MTHLPPSIDIFCRVVDNLGDIGVTWRLAHQLHREKNCAVRLIVDNLDALRKLVPETEAQAVQAIKGVTVMHWTSAEDYYETCAAVVIEAFACTLPGFVLRKIKEAAPVWIDLEYLSAEDWVSDRHAVISPHPTLGVNKTLFFPGFSAQTGGLIRERNLLQKKHDFKNSQAAQNLWRQTHKLPLKDKNTKDISLFCYKTAPFQLLELTRKTNPLRLFTTPEIAAILLQQFPLLPVFSFDFLPQHEYDFLLWTCDVNFVRGEDSFIRALWAGQPFIWQIYAQADGAHWPKLEAFLNYYCQGLPAQDADPLADFTAMWNQGGQNDKTTEEIEAKRCARFFARLPALSDFARQRADQQAMQDDLATRLLRFIDTQRQAQNKP